MPLITSETDAIKILRRKYEKDGETGLISFARDVLGAHSRQANRLVNAAIDNDFTLARDKVDTVQVTQEIDGKELSLTLKADRLPLTSYQELVDFYEINTDVWRPTSQSFSFWGNSTNPNFSVKATFQRDSYQDSLDQDREAFREWASQFSPVDFTPNSDTPDSERLMVEFVVADLHAGKVSVHGDELMETMSRLLEAALMTIADVKSQHGRIAQARLIFLGDTFNADNQRGTTTNGTPQEETVDWRKTFTVTRQYIATIALRFQEELADMVHIHVLPGNHDFERSYYLSDSLYSYFVNHPNITVETSAERSYIRWGSNLIGLAHGDEGKPVDYAMTMFREAATDEIDNFEWHFGHIHTRRLDEQHGVTFRWFRTVTEPGSWEVKKLYNHNRREIVSLIWDAVDGNIAQLNYRFR